VTYVTAADVPARCPRCNDPMPDGRNYRHLCATCRDDLREKAASYGGSDIEVLMRYYRLRDEASR